jgi:hypothetical protein
MMVRTARERVNEERLILWGAGCEAHRLQTREQVEPLTELVDWSLVAELLRARRLLATLGPRIIELAGERASDEFNDAVGQALQNGLLQGAFLQMISTRVMAALAAAEIRCSPLKGPHLSEALYGDVARRPSSDIDLLVAREQLQAAVEVVREFGYEAPTDYLADGGLPLLHFVLIHARGELPPVELHWRIHWYEHRFAGDRLLVPPAQPANGWRAAPIDELTSLLLFYARDGFVDLRHATDVGACWDAIGASLPPAALDDTIRAYPALEHVLMVAARVAERTVGLPLQRLTERRQRLAGRDRIAIRLATPHPRASEPQLYADMGLIDGLLAPPGGFRAFIRRQVIPPRKVLREHARRDPQDRVGSSVGHGVRVVSRYGLAMARLLHPQASTWPR